ncbi:MAG TPA: AMP-binding protein, partial [Deltaproteobacteria bacterium]|nr:AMP-binding protein [Deltaproteobacteria bacterium]
VPTIWMLLYDYLEKGGWHDFSSLKTIARGGAAIPRQLLIDLNEKYGFPIKQAYGSTETTPLVSAAIPKSYMADWPSERLYDVKTSAGLLAMGLEMKIVKDDGTEVKMDGTEWGEICLRGPWIANEYYKDPERSKETFGDGWYHTGDIATIDEEGYIRLVDRKKDLVKSAGEWISSVDLENLIMAHPKIMEAAIIGVPHPKWQERPLACVVPVPGQNVTADEIKEFLQDKVKASWWIPDEIIVLKEIPKTSVGKFNKRELRQLYAEGKLTPQGQA